MRFETYDPCETWLWGAMLVSKASPLFPVVYVCTCACTRTYTMCILYIYIYMEDGTLYTYRKMYKYIDVNVHIYYDYMLSRCLIFYVFQAFSSDSTWQLTIQGMIWPRIEREWATGEVRSLMAKGGAEHPDFVHCFSCFFVVVVAIECTHADR